MENPPSMADGSDRPIRAADDRLRLALGVLRGAVDRLRIFLEWYGKLVLVSFFVAVVIGAGAPPIVDLYHRITALEYQRTQNTDTFQEDISGRVETMDSLARIIESPKLLSPPDSAQINSSLAELRWSVSARGRQNQLGPTDHSRVSNRILTKYSDPTLQPTDAPTIERNSSGDYVVEIRALTTDRVVTMELATNPDDGVHHLPDLPQGDYIWRVARRIAASPVSDAYEDFWSGYSRFTIPGPASQKELSVAINYAQQSRFMTRTSEGGYCGFDWGLISWIAKQMGKTPVPHEYPTVPAMLDATANGLEDVAIGSITRTRSRQEEGIAFTGGYLRSPPVMACTSDDSECPTTWPQVALALDGDEVGVIQDTTNDDLARELQASLHFVRKPVSSVDSLIRALKNHQLGWILVDRPLINGACNSSAFRCFVIPSRLVPKYEAELGRPNSEEYALASDNEAIRREITNLLATRIAQEFLYKLSDKYLSASPDKTLTKDDCQVAGVNEMRGGGQ